MPVSSTVTVAPLTAERLVIVAAPPRVLGSDRMTIPPSAFGTTDAF
jgi:hypothetical protein